uniref:Nck-associated protein 5 C-terminal domain-containing protein n=1 Tax=Erpetoichthys calabaricus TaxID=27687 RepID=A0A8C4S8C5_ERPCA
SEKRLREVTVESEHSRDQMLSLQQRFSSEEAQNEGNGTEKEGNTTKLLLERLRALEAENSALAMENETQREQYERCLDEVANQVVQALLTQKDLREECLKLRTRVFDLEQQNRTLSVLFQQRVRPASDLLLQGVQQSMKSAIPVLKCHNQLSLTVPSQLYPRSSCSSSELSLSSACSEFSSGSYTWNDGKSCSKKVGVYFTLTLQDGCSNCQMRTLDSGIGTFPLPDSANKATGRHIPKSESDPEKVVRLSPSLREIPSQEMVVKANTLEREVPSTSEAIQEEKTVICHSLSDSVMAAKTQRAFRSQLPLPASSGKLSAVLLTFFLIVECTLCIGKGDTSSIYQGAAYNDSDSVHWGGTLAWWRWWWWCFPCMLFVCSLCAPVGFLPQYEDMQFRWTGDAKLLHDVCVCVCSPCN